jgi:L-alanine-DL-glutamate epimerase-like enolase superfamily enzyme
MKLHLRDLSLPLRHPFTTSHGTLTVQNNLLVVLEDESGTQGLGEAPCSRAWPQYSASNIRSALESARDLIETAPFFNHPEAFWHLIQPQLSSNPFALSALDQAAHDLWGKQQNQPVWQLWGLQSQPLPLTSYTIGLDSIAQMLAKMREFEPWPIYKIKLGTPDDLSLVRSLRQHTSATFRIDANTAWTVQQTLDFAPELKSLGVEFIEQPLPRDDWSGMAEVHAHCALPVFADESCQTEEDVERCAGHFTGINIKLSKAGGLTPAGRMIRRARELGLQIMVGCMCESSVGISAIAQLLPQLDFADIDGALLLAEDIADGITIDHGTVRLSDLPGTGARLR